MTGGRVVVLGPTGRNFAAGMSGGIAYIWDRDGTFNLNCNLATVALEKIETAEEEEDVKEMISRHQQLTLSAVAAEALEHWDDFLGQCVKVMPTDYKRVLEEMKQQETATA
jgi:glutamate synthase (NADPH/NADH) large chain